MLFPDPLPLLRCLIWIWSEKCYIGVVVVVIAWGWVNSALDSELGGNLEIEKEVGVYLCHHIFGARTAPVIPSAHFVIPAVILSASSLVKARP